LSAIVVESSSCRPSPAWLTPLEIGVLGAIWGASFLFMRVAAPHFGAAPTRAISR